jgi:hypothetical protein
MLPLHYMVILCPLGKEHINGVEYKLSKRISWPWKQGVTGEWGIKGLCVGVQHIKGLSKENERDDTEWYIQTKITESSMREKKIWETFLYPSIRMTTGLPWQESHVEGFCICSSEPLSYNKRKQGIYWATE